MAKTIETELAVLGAGPGGYAAAFLAADKGMEVTLIDSRSLPGGVCLHCGCIPSKALLHAAKLINDAKEAADWGLKFTSPKIDLDKLRERKKKIVGGMAEHLGASAKQRKVNFVHATGKLADSNTLELENGDKVRFQKCILATGSSPTRLPFLNIDHPAVVDSTGILELEDIPKKMLVVGGGYIGLEMGSVFAALGTKVHVVEMMGNLLPGVDTDLVRPLHQRLKEEFKKIMLNTKVQKIEPDGKSVKAHFEGEEIDEKVIEYDRVLIAIGRKPNSQNIGLDNTEIEVDDKGFVKVDGHRQTTEKGIYAIGDLAGEPMLAHKASHEGKVAVQSMLGEPAIWDVRAIPAVVFTDPEIAWCGLTESEAKKENRKVKVARFDWRASGRATTLGRNDGLTKLIVDPETDRLLGMGLTGTEAGEMISEGVVAIEMGATALDLGMSIHPHPTLTETIMEAGESLHGLATHLYKPRK